MRLLRDKKTGEVFRRLHIIEEDFSFDHNQEWHLKDILYIPVDGKEIAFRVEHISDDKVYFVAVNIVDVSAMTGMEMDIFLDNFLSKMPEGLVENLCDIEHKMGNKIIRKSKLTLLSGKNIHDMRNWYDGYNGADDIAFDGLKSYAELCKNYKGETYWYWLDTPNPCNNTDSMYVGQIGGHGFYYTSCIYGVVPVFAICKR